MKDTILALFGTYNDANQALRELSEEGYTEADVSVVTKEDNIPTREDAEESESGVAGGAKTGGLVGGIVGLLVGIGALAIPGIGALFIGGPLAAAFGLTGVTATTATGALTGALAGGLLGALKDIGVDEVRARIIEDRVKEGDILITVVPSEDDAENVKTILRNNNAQHISQMDLRV